MNLVLTFYIGPKANSNASTHTNYLITLLKNEAKKGSDPFSHLTHNYTGEPEPLHSPRLPVCLDFWGLTREHRAPSERGIIAGTPARSTPYFQSCERIRSFAGDRPHDRRPSGLSAVETMAWGWPGWIAGHSICLSACHCLY